MKHITRNILLAITLFAVIGIIQACGGATAAQPSAPASAGTISSLPPAPPAVTKTTSSVTSTPKNSGQGQQNPLKATWITPQVAGDIVSIPLSEVESKGIIHFKVASGGKTTTYMAYNLDGTLYVRANVCPPCRSIGFSLYKGTLVCDTCRTRFDAKTGEGISGACVAFPKAAAAYKTSDGNISMNTADLLTAYQNTIEQGLP